MTKTCKPTVPETRSRNVGVGNRVGSAGAATQKVLQLGPIIGIRKSSDGHPEPPGWRCAALGLIIGAAAVIVAVVPVPAVWDSGALV